MNRLFCFLTVTECRVRDAYNDHLVLSSTAFIVGEIHGLLLAKTLRALDSRAVLFSRRIQGKRWYKPSAREREGGKREGEGGRERERREREREREREGDREAKRERGREGEGGVERGMRREGERGRDGGR